MCVKDCSPWCGHPAEAGSLATEAFSCGPGPGRRSFPHLSRRDPPCLDGWPTTLRRAISSAPPRNERALVPVPPSTATPSTSHDPVHVPRPRPRTCSVPRPRPRPRPTSMSTSTSTSPSIPMAMSHLLSTPPVRVHAPPPHSTPMSYIYAPFSCSTRLSSWDSCGTVKTQPDC